MSCLFEQEDFKIKKKLKYHTFTSIQKQIVFSKLKVSFCSPIVILDYKIFIKRLMISNESQKKKKTKCNKPIFVLTKMF